MRKSDMDAMFKTSKNSVAKVRRNTIGLHVDRWVLEVQQSGASGAVIAGDSRPKAAHHGTLAAGV